jgi:hypothetical protein
LSLSQAYSLARSPHRLAVLRWLVLFQIAGEQDYISVGIINHGKTHPNGGVIGLAMALEAETSVCFRSFLLFLYRLDDDTPHLFCAHGGFSFLA